MATAKPGALHLHHDGVTSHGWRIKTVKGPITNDKECEEFRQQLGGDVLTLPEMLFNHNTVELHHIESGVSIVFNALEALKAWKKEDLPPLQVKLAEEWRKAREHEIQAQKAIQLEYDWTFTTPYAGTLVQSATHAVGSEPGKEPNVSTCTASPQWEETTEQIDRSLLMERDPILFYDDVMLYESDLDDNGVSQLSVKLRVMPRCWLVLLRFWMRVDGSMVRLREARLFCRHDRPHRHAHHSHQQHHNDNQTASTTSPQAQAASSHPHTATASAAAAPGPPVSAPAGRPHIEVLREVKHCEGRFDELRAKGAPPEGPAYTDADAASQVFAAIAPVGLTKLSLHKLVLQ